MTDYYPIDADAVARLWDHVFKAKSPETQVTIPAVELFAALGMIDKLLRYAPTPQDDDGTLETLPPLELKLPQHWLHAPEKVGSVPDDPFYVAWKKLQGLDPESTKILFDHILRLERESIETHGLTLTTPGA